MANVGKNKKKTILGYELTLHQNAIFNYLIPAICSCILYMFIIAIDISVIFRHYKDEDPIWASLTIFIMYSPVIGSYIVLISNWDLWPEYIGYGLENIKWCIVKTLEHLFFPIWNMWRFAERIFWSIEAVRGKDEKLIQEATDHVDEPRSIELYTFLQAYLHALPQILFQLFILMRHKSDIDKQTKDAQILSIVFNLAKLSVTTTYYQRFKAQKLAGRQYPWYKEHKLLRHTEIDHGQEVVLRRPQMTIPAKSVIEDMKRESQRLSHKYKLEPSTVPERRRSSDFYLEPSSSQSGSRGTSNIVSGRLTDIDDDGLMVPKKQLSVDEVDSRKKGIRRIVKEEQSRISIVDNFKQLFRDTGASQISEPDFNISRVLYVKGLAEDDLAGKLIAFWWWFAFLLARILAISAFAYFYLNETIYILVSHFLIVIGFLLYDVKSNEVRRAKGIFFIFLGLVFIFCIIEFKFRFKKATLLYYGYFVLVFLENLIMCLIWYDQQLDSLENEFWFRFIFLVIVMCSLCSFVAMAFYFFVTKPKKVIVEATVQN